MSAILGGGEVPVKAGRIAGDNAFPIAINFADERGVVTGVVVGGLTKRQELAARFLAFSIGDTLNLGQQPSSFLIGAAIQLADSLLAATEPKP